MISESRERMSIQQDKPGSAGITPGYLVVEGPIGVGKTSLAQKLSLAFGSDLLLERPRRIRSSNVSISRTSISPADPAVFPVSARTSDAGMETA